MVLCGGGGGLLRLQLGEGVARGEGGVVVGQEGRGVALLLRLCNIYMIMSLTNYDELREPEISARFLS